MKDQRYEDLDKAAEDGFKSLLNNVSQYSDGYDALIDPIDQERLGDHYGESHLCAALFLRAKRTQDYESLDMAKSLLKGLMQRYGEDRNSAQYHADFNNFAFCIIYHALCDMKSEMAVELESIIINLKASKNSTVNWLPMRAYVYYTKYEITHTKQYLHLANSIIRSIDKIAYDDGLLDDLFPKGTSFNLQYCISTIACLKFVHETFKESTVASALNIDKGIRTLSKLILPDGDINYLGRGCNQLFAWGPWIYIVRSTPGIYKPTNISYFTDTYAKIINNYNLLLNELKGEKKLLWWDYHHYSVYAAHYLLWYELGKKNYDAESIDTNAPGEAINEEFESGLKIDRNANFFVVSFNGRNRYLTEKGPQIAAICSSKYGTIFKGGHGATRDHFGEKYFNPITAYLNHFGLIELHTRPSKARNRVERKLHDLIVHKANTLAIMPKYLLKNVILNESELILHFRGRRRKEMAFSIPVPERMDINSCMTLYADNRPISLRIISKMYTQYGICDLYISDCQNANEWKLAIRA